MIDALAARLAEAQKFLDVAVAYKNSTPGLFDLATAIERWRAADGATTT